MASELQVQTISGPPTGANANKILIPSGQTLTLEDKLAYNNLPSGTVIAVNTVRYATRTAASGLPLGYVYFSGSFTKHLDTSKIVATCTVFGAGYNNGNNGVGLKLDNTWDYGVAYQYDGAWSATQQTTIIVGQCEWSGFAAGTHTIGFGANAANGAGTSVFNVINPNSNDDARNQQMVSSIIVYEVAA